MRYIAVTVERKVIVEEGLGKCVPVPKGTTTLNSFTNPKGKAKDTNGDSLFHMTETEPNENQVTRMIALATANTVKECMSNHYYTFNGDIRRQKEGGAIGSDLTGETSRVVMVDIDSRILKKLKVLGIKIRYL